MSRSRIGSAHGLSPLTTLIARAAAGSHAASLNGADLQTAVTELAHLARVSVLQRGVVASDELRAAVDAVAGRHLKRATAERHLSRLLGKVGDRQLRNAIEVAHDQVMEPSEVAHYYAGLMAGLALLEFGRSR
jgi:hypothetical protein